MRTIAIVATGLLSCQASAAGERSAAPAEKQAPLSTNVVLRLDPGPNGGSAGVSMWRYTEAWQTEVVRLGNGELIRVDPSNPWVPGKREVLGGEKFESAVRAIVKLGIQPTGKIAGSRFPPTDWKQTGFDDSEWTRTSGPVRPRYRSLSIMCLRGKFEVKDPAQVAGLTLSMAFRGGAVVYLNGKEVGRAFMPKGETAWDTPAEDYPMDVFVATNGIRLLTQALDGDGRGSQYLSRPDELRLYSPRETRDRYQQRTRRVELQIPARAISKGTNVLALELHRAPAAAAMIELWFEGTYGVADGRGSWWWDRLGMEDICLTATVAGPPAGGTAVVPADVVPPNVAPPKGIQVWKQNIYDLASGYGDPNEAVAPLRFFGGKNGAYAAQLVIGATGAIKGLTVRVADLKSGGRTTIPASAVEVRYLQSAGFGLSRREDMEATVPSEISAAPGRAGMQPVWFTIQVPKEAGAGEYAGQATIAADGLPPVDVPMQLHVSEWTLPDARDFTTQINIVQSPETVAMRYNVPLWSEEHWKLLDATFKHLGRIGTRSVYVPLVGGSFDTTLGHEHSMVYSLKQPDATYKHDYAIVDRYLGLAVKYLGTNILVSVICMECPGGYDCRDNAKNPFLFTEKDAKTGELKEVAAPVYGTPESVAFLKPLFAGLNDVFKKHGLPERAMCVGFHNKFYGPGWCGTKESDADFGAVIPPQARWFGGGHYLIWAPKRDATTGVPSFSLLADGHEWGYIWIKSGGIGVFWDPDADKPIFGWRNPEQLFAYPFCGNGDNAGSRVTQRHSLPAYRVCAEGSLLTGHRGESVKGLGRGNPCGAYGEKFMGAVGLGPLGGDYWPVLKGAHGDKALGTLPQTELGNISLPVGWLLSPGKDAPVSTIRAELLREGLQEAEARIFVQNALLDEKTRSKLGPALAARAKALCDERTRVFRYFSEYCWDADYDRGIPFNPVEWTEMSRRLYDMTEEVAKAIGK